MSEDVWGGDVIEEGVPVDDDGMTDEERKVAAEVYEAMMESMRRSDRSQQAQEFRVGISDLGYCSERLRRFLDRQVPDDTDMLAAFHGTWLGEGIEQAYKALHPEAIIQAEVSVTLKGETNTYVIPGHPDIIDGNMVLDCKSAFGLEAARRGGMDDQQKKYQRHNYALAAWEAGLFGDIALDDIKVGNLWVDRSASEKRLFVKLEPFSLEVVEESVRWLDSVVYAWQNNEEAEKEPPREVCAVTCGFFEKCRAFDTDVTGLITDPTLLMAAQMAIEATDHGRRAKALRSEAKDLLDGIAGSTGTHTVRWIEIGASEVAGFTRKPYKKLQITKIREPKK